MPHDYARNGINDLLAAALNIATLYRCIRSWLVMALYWVKDATNRSQRRKARAVIAALDLPVHLPRQRRVRDSVWGIAMVRNEADVIRATVLHQLNQGLDAVLVADNGSTDATIEILSELATDHPVYIAHDRMTAYYQGEKMTNLSQVARRAGADWVVPFDADEFWFAADSTVAEFLRGCRQHYVYGQMHNLFPLANTTAIDGRTMFNVDTSKSKHRKVAFRTHRLARLAMGNHHVTRSGSHTGGLFVAHLPWRSYKQFRQKVEQGWTALSSTDLPANVSRHWRRLAALEESELQAEWERLLSGRSKYETSWSPVGPFLSERLLEWKTWDPHGALRGGRTNRESTR